MAFKEQLDGGQFDGKRFCGSKAQVISTRSAAISFGLIEFACCAKEDTTKLQNLHANEREK